MMLLSTVVYADEGMPDTLDIETNVTAEEEGSAISLGDTVGEVDVRDETVSASAVEEETTDTEPEVVSSVNLLATTTTTATGSFTDGVVGGSIEYTIDDAGITITKAVGNVVSAVIPEEIDGVEVIAIGEKAFYQSDCKNTLMEVVLPDTITSIGKNAFKDRVQLVTINMPSSLQVLGDSAFSGCTRLKSVDMSNITLTEMGTGVFENCSTLTGVNTGGDTSCFYLPGGLTTLPKNTFKGCSRLQNVAGLEGIQKIDEGAFMNCEFFDQIYIPSSVTEIAKSAFSGCTRMVTVTGCEQLATLGDSVFNTCTSLINLPVDTLEQQIKEWGTGIFTNCTSLRSFKIPINVSEIPDSTFDGCTALQDMEIPEGITRIGISAFEDCTSLKKVDLTAQTGLYIIEKRAWRGCTGIEDVTIESSTLRGIDANAFTSCTSLKTASITSSNAAGLSLGGGVFNGCSSLVSCHFDTTFSLDNDNYFGESTFANCVSLEDVNFAEGLTILPERTFYNCTKLDWDAEKYLPSTISTIGPEAFSKCQFTNVSIPEHIQVIDESAFSGCTAMTDFSVTEKLRLLNDKALYGCTSLVNVSLKDGLETINDSVFGNCSSMETLEIPDTVVYMGDSTFSDCTSLKMVKLPKNLEAATQNMFKNCSSLESVDLLNTKVTSIKANAFDGCTSLKEVSLPKDITSIDDYAFRKCTSLESITFPRSLLTLGKNVFTNCTSLEQCNLNEGLKIIGNQAFSGCTSLRALFLPTTATSIGNEICSGCTGLTEVIIPKSVNSIGTRIFRNIDTEITVYCEETAPIRNYSFESDNVITFESEILVPDTVEGLIFDAGLYSSHYPEIAECFNNNEGYLYLHWKNFGIYNDAIGEEHDGKAVSTGSYIFNAAEYANYNPDLAEAGITSPADLLEHFVTVGYNEKRDISVHYSVRTYSLQYPDKDGEELIKLYLENRLTDNADPIDTLLGDVNGDGEVNSKDTIRLMRYIAKDDVSIDTSAADVNEDGMIDSRDTIRLMRNISGM